MTVPGVLGLDADVAVDGRERRAFRGCFHLDEVGTDVGGVVVVPDLIADVLLDHHAVPLATGDLLIVLQVQLLVAFEGLAAAFCPAVRLGIVLGGQLVVHGLGVVHLVDVAHGLDGEEDDLTVGVAGFGLECDELPEGTGLQSLIVADDLGKLPGGVGLGVEHLGGDAAVVLAHEVQQLGCLAGLVFAETLGAEVTGMVQKIIDTVLRGIPRHISCNCSHMFCMGVTLIHFELRGAPT